MAKAKTPRKGAPAAVSNVEIVEEKKGLDGGTGMVLVTALLLVVAILVLCKELARYGAGPLASS